jgi:8-oxo-dGTP pyrophosphatase MutT (NUDIX family)
MAMTRIQTKYSGRVVTVNVETVRLPNGREADLDIVHHPGGAAIVAVDAARNVCLLRQFRHAAGGWIRELPAGKLEPGEAPLAAAQRELVEEAGVAAGEWVDLQPVHSSPGVFTEVIHLFLATDLAPRLLAHEPNEVIEVHWIPLADAVALALDGGIHDAKTVIGLLRAAARLG